MADTVAPHPVYLRVLALGCSRPPDSWHTCIGQELPSSRILTRSPALAVPSRLCPALMSPCRVGASPGMAL